MIEIAALDAVFLAAAVTLTADRRGELRWVALVPLLAAVAALAPAGAYAYLVPPVVALLATAPPVRAPAPALVLAAPAYGSLVAAVTAGAAYLAAIWLADGLDRRIEQRGVSASWRGAPARLLVIAALYAALQPVGHL